MRLEGQHEFTSGRAEVWRALQDPQILANALPGVRRLEADGPDRYRVTVTVGVGAIKGAYDGAFWLSDKHELESCTVQAEATGPPGSIATTAAMRLSEGGANGGTLLTYEADAKVTGPLAGVGQRMVAAAAKRTTREFLAAIDRELVAGPSAQAAAPAPQTTPGAGEGAASAPPSAGVFVPSSPAGGDRGDLRLFVGGALTGFVLAIVGVLVGRRTARPVTRARS